MALISSTFCTYCMMHYFVSLLRKVTKTLCHSVSKPDSLLTHTVDQNQSWLATTKLVVAIGGMAGPADFSRGYTSDTFIPAHFRWQDLVQASQTTLSQRAFVYLWTGLVCRVWWKPEMHGVLCALMSLHQALCPVNVNCIFFFAARGIKVMSGIAITTLWCVKCSSMTMCHMAYTVTWYWCLFLPQLVSVCTHAGFKVEDMFRSDSHYK